MGGLIEGAKQKIWSICNQIASGKPIAGTQGRPGRLPRHGRRIHHQGHRPDRRPRRHPRPSEEVHGQGRRRHSRERQPGPGRRRQQGQLEHRQGDAADHLPGRRRSAAHGLHGRRQVSGDLQEGLQKGHHHQHHPVRPRRRMHQVLEGHLPSRPRVPSLQIAAGRRRGSGRGNAVRQTPG